jgi:hypothetical protein
MKNTSLRISRRITPHSAGAVAALSLMLVSGCASVGAPPQSNTLSAFEQLSIQADGSRAWRDDKAGRYDTVRIEAARIVFGPDVQIDGERREELRLALSSALAQRFASAGLQVAKGAKPADGRHAIAVRATITAVDLTSPALNVVTTLLLLAPLSRGGLTIEMEAVDVGSGQRVAALAFAGKAGLENIASAYSSTGHARLQVNEGAKRFVALFAGNPTSIAPANK